MMDWTEGYTDTIMYRDQYLFSDEIYALVGKNIRVIRQSLGVKQTVLSIQADVDQKQLSLIESGKARPRLSVYLRIANALQVSMNQLLAGSNTLGQEETPGWDRQTVNQAKGLLLQLLVLINTDDFAYGEDAKT